MRCPLRPSAEAAEPDQTRTLTWSYYEEGRRFGLSTDLPAAQGAVVARALERLAESLPQMPGEEDHSCAPARRADALVALCSARISSHPDPDRATVVIHAQAEGLLQGTSGCEIEGGPVIHPQVARRLACTGRLQVVVEDEQGQPLHVGKMRRDPPAWMMRQLTYRDHGCTFPGCGVGPSPRPTTSRGGRREAGPISTTWSWCARSTTSWCTSTDGSFGDRPTERSGGSTPTG
jgi:uncharacterized protein DUF222